MNKEDIEEELREIRSAMVGLRPGSDKYIELWAEMDNLELQLRLQREQKK